MFYFLFRFGYDQRLLVAVIVEGEELVVFSLANRIVLVRMAACTTHGQPEPHGTRCLGAIKAGLDSELLLIGSPLRIGQSLAVECGRQPLHRGSVGKQVAR